MVSRGFLSGGFSAGGRFGGPLFLEPRADVVQPVIAFMTRVLEERPPRVFGFMISRICSARLAVWRSLKRSNERRLETFVLIPSDFVQIAMRRQLVKIL